VIIFYSGDGCPAMSHPEILWGIDANVMLTYMHSHDKKKPESRFRAIKKIRRQYRRSRREEAQGESTIGLPD
jgi:hypothetical protein